MKQCRLPDSVNNPCREYGDALDKTVETVQRLVIFPSRTFFLSIGWRERKKERKKEEEKRKRRRKVGSPREKEE